MLKRFLSALAFCVALPAFAEPVATLETPSQTLRITGEAAELTISYERVGDLVDVTMLFTDDSGDVLRTGILLQNQQSHAVTLSSDYDIFSTTYLVHRAGHLVGIHVREDDTLRLIASR